MEQSITISFQLVFQTGLFLDDCKTWKRLPAARKTWATFKTFFATVHQEWRELQVTTSGAGFQLANNLYQQDLYQQETVDDIANLATATASDRTSVAAITATNTTLTTKLLRTTQNLLWPSRTMPNFQAQSPICTARTASYSPPPATTP